MPIHKKRILVICSRNKRRSLTAEKMFQHSDRFVVRSAGTSPKARHQVSIKDMEWADIILCMEQKHKEQLQRLFAKLALQSIVVADIPDDYKFMDPELKESLQAEIDNLLQDDCASPKYLSLH